MTEQEQPATALYKAELSELDIKRICKALRAVSDDLFSISLTRDDEYYAIAAALEATCLVAVGRYLQSLTK